MNNPDDLHGLIDEANSEVETGYQRAMAATPLDRVLDTGSRRIAITGRRPIRVTVLITTLLRRAGTRLKA